MGYNVAIDGPAGAGKSTIARLVAKEKEYIYVDTGAMYRGLAIHFLDQGIDAGETEMTSKCSAIPEVREKLLDLQRELARTQDVIMDGRDIGTCVLPDADVKVYLTASVKTRAKRRYDELAAKGESCSLDEIERDIEERDERDMNRETAPLRQAEDAVLVDSSDMTIEDVVRTIAGLCK